MMQSVRAYILFLLQKADRLSTNDPSVHGFATLGRNTFTCSLNRTLSGTGQTGNQGALDIRREEHLPRSRNSGEASKHHLWLSSGRGTGCDLPSGLSSVRRLFGRPRSPLALACRMAKEASVGGHPFRSQLRRTSHHGLFLRYKIVVARPRLLQSKSAGGKESRAPA